MTQQEKLNLIADYQKRSASLNIEPQKAKAIRSAVHRAVNEHREAYRLLSRV